MLEIRHCAVEEFFAHPDSSVVLAEYAAESGVDGLPPPHPHKPTYLMLEQAGSLRVIAAHQGERMVGFITLLIYLNPHYSALIGVSESFFVRPEYRKTGAGMRLLRYTEAAAGEAGAVGLLMSAPKDSRLADVLDALDDYREAHRIFFRPLP